MSYLSRWLPLVDETAHTALTFGFLRHAPTEHAPEPRERGGGRPAPPIERKIAKNAEKYPAGGAAPSAAADRGTKASVGKSCVRFKRTAEVDHGVLRELIADAGWIGPGAQA